jgi:arsenite-transporting ATPase
LRVLLFTGKGGVGKTTTAAATAVHAARRGTKTLVLSTDASHSLGDALGTTLAGEPSEVEPGLFAQQVEARSRAERSWRGIQEYLLSVLEATGVEPVAAEELTVLPGAEEVLALLVLRDHVRAGPWDLVIVDCAPTAETLRLLALPEALSWYMAKALPPERRFLRALRPVLDRSAVVPAPPDSVFDAANRLRAELGDVRAVLTDPQTSVRLVLTPEAVVVAEARRTLTSLALYGYVVDGVVANRVIGGGEDPWRSAWARSHARRLQEVQESFAPVPVLLCPYLDAEPVGLEALAAVAEVLYSSGVSDPLVVPAGSPPLSVERSGEEFVLEVRLPLADRKDVDLARRGDDLVLSVGGYRRFLSLPSALRRCVVVGASLRDGRLRVRFLPDPELWLPL